MDEQLTRRLLRQVKILNGLIIFFAVVFLTLFAIAGIFAYQAVQEVRQARDALSSVQTRAEDTLNIQDELCNGNGTLSSLTRDQTSICD